MSKYSWNDTKLQAICGQCHFKDENPDLCHSVEPPIIKTFIPDNTSSCSFLRESQWQRMPKEEREKVNKFIKERSERYYSGTAK